MSNTLDEMPLELLSGQEPVAANAGPEMQLVNYWQWSGSGLMENTQRGVLAEFLVAVALGVHRTPRKEWGNHDLQADLDGRCIKIEVKSSAERQSWKGSPCGFHQFDIRKTEDSEGKKPGSRRWADVYVFCILKNLHATSQLEALDARNWEFLVLATDKIDQLRPDQRSIRAGPLREIGAVSCVHSELAETIAEATRMPV